MYSNTLSALLTVDDRNQLFEVLDEVQRRLYQEGGQKLEDILQHLNIPADIHRALQADFRDASQDAVAFVEGVSQAAKALVPLKLTVAKQPSQMFLQEIAAWLEREVGPQLLMELKIDAAIVGGAVLEYQGKYADYSLRTRLDAVLRTMKVPEKIEGGAG